MAEVKYSKAIAESIENYLNEKEWKFMPVDENGVIRTGLKLRNKLKSVDIFFPELKVRKAQLSKVFRILKRYVVGKL